jgi:hypothetical protein
MPSNVAATGAKRRFCLVLVKPTRYCDDDYPIRWFRSTIPSNSLACVYGIAKDCNERRVLGDDVEIDIHAIDEFNTRIWPDRIAALIKGADDGMVFLVGVQSNQTPRALDIARPLRQAGIKVGIGGFHMSGVISMINGDDPALREAQAMGLSVFAGEAEGRLDEVLRDAYADRLKSLYNYMDDAPGINAAPARAGSGQAHGRIDDELRCRARLSLSMLVLHDHQRAGAQITPPYRGRHRRRRSPQCGARRLSILHHGRQLRA